MTLDERYLDDIESHMLGAAPGHLVEYTGTLDEDALVRALDLLARRYPILRATVRHDGHGYLLQATPDGRPPLVTVTGGEHDAAAVIASPWDPEARLARALHCRGDGGGFLGMQIDHAVVDGRSLRAIFDDLLALYTTVAAEDDLTVGAPGSLPASPRSVFADRTGGPSPDDTTRPPRVTGRMVPPVLRRIEFDHEATAELVDTSRRRRTSMHALFCGAVLLAQRAQDTGTADTARMVCLSPVDLRGRVSPAVGATDTTNFLGLHRYELEVGIGDDPVALGSDVKRDLEKALAAGEIPPIDLPRNRRQVLESPLSPHLAMAQISNNGVLKRKVQHGRLTLRRVLTVPHVVRAAYPVYSVYTFEQRLTIACVFPSDLFPEPLADAIAAHIRATLTGADALRVAEFVD